MPSPSRLWSVPSIWAGQTAFILGGGPSASPQIPFLRGKNVIAINSAWTSLPSAPFLFFADSRWWKAMEKSVRGKYNGQIVTVAQDIPSTAPCLRLKRVDPPSTQQLHRLTPPLFDMAATSAGRDSLVMRRTSLAGATHLAGLFGATTVVWVGADGKLAKDGRRHHHSEVYPWPLQSASFDAWRAELTKMAPIWKAAGLTVLNASPGSAFKMVPAVRLEDQ